MSFRKLQVVVTDPARADISDILIYTEKQWDSLQRDDYWRQIGETLERLAVMPSIGRVHDNISSFGLRSVPVGSHLLYYWIDGDRLVIARVLHSRQDVELIGNLQATIPARTPEAPPRLPGGSGHAVRATIQADMI